MTDDDTGDSKYVEATLQPGDPVAVVGSTTHDEFAGSIRVDASVVAAGDLETLERDLRQRAVRTGGEGLAMALGGYAGMLLAAGAL